MMGYCLRILHCAEHQFVIILTKQLLWKAVVYSAQRSGFLEWYFTPKHSSSVIPNGGCRLLHPAPLAVVGWIRLGIGPKLGEEEPSPAPDHTHRGLPNPLAESFTFSLARITTACMEEE